MCVLIYSDSSSLLVDLASQWTFERDQLDEFIESIYDIPIFSTNLSVYSAFFFPLLSFPSSIHTEACFFLLAWGMIGKFPKLPSHVTNLASQLHRGIEIACGHTPNLTSAIMRSPETSAVVSTLLDL